MVCHREAYSDLYFLYFIQMTYQIPLNTAKQYYSLMTPQYMPLGTIVLIYSKKSTRTFLISLTGSEQTNSQSMPVKQSICLYPARTIPQKSTATLKIDDENLDQVTHTKFLGLLLDQHLCWDQHIQYCAKKISSGLYALNSAKHILNSCHLRMLYHTMVNPYLLYGNILWGGAYQKYTKRLNIMQKRAIRTIMNATYNEHTSPLFKATNILKLTDLHDFQVIKFMGKFMHNELPLPLLELFQSQVVNHEHDTRHRDGPNLPLSHSEIMRRSIFHRGPNLWMNLPNHLRTTATTNALVNNWRKDKISQY